MSNLFKSTNFHFSRADKKSDIKLYGLDNQIGAPVIYCHCIASKAY